MLCIGVVAPDVVFLVLLQLVCGQPDGLAAPSVLQLQGHRVFRVETSQPATLGSSSSQPWQDPVLSLVVSSSSSSSVLGAGHPGVGVSSVVTPFRVCFAADWTLIIFPPVAWVGAVGGVPVRGDHLQRGIISNYPRLKSKRQKDGPQWGSP